MGRTLPERTNGFLDLTYLDAAASVTGGGPNHRKKGSLQERATKTGQNRLPHARGGHTRGGEAGRTDGGIGDPI